MKESKKCTSYDHNQIRVGPIVSLDFVNTSPKFAIVTQILLCKSSRVAKHEC